MTVNLSAYVLLAFAYILMVFDCFLILRKYEKLSKENEELKESIVILKNWIEEKLNEVEHE